MDEHWETGVREGGEEGLRAHHPPPSAGTGRLANATPAITGPEDAGRGALRKYSVVGAMLR